MDKLLLLDKDGTLVQATKGKFVTFPWEQDPLPGATEALEKYLDDGWMACVVSNQGGVEAGHKSLESTFEEMIYCRELFPKIEEFYFCPGFQGSVCWRLWGQEEDQRIKYDKDPVDLMVASSLVNQFRKPKPGMIYLAMHIHAPEQVLFVGDREEDYQAAENAGVDFLWANAWRKDNGEKYL
jgi:D-glycero-D-manno-heptose 1,7-bisphosphate phosphatase